MREEFPCVGLAIAMALKECVCGVCVLRACMCVRARVCVCQCDRLNKRQPVVARQCTGQWWASVSGEMRNVGIVGLLLGHDQDQGLPLTFCHQASTGGGHAEVVPHQLPQASQNE